MKMFRTAVVGIPFCMAFLLVGCAHRWEQPVRADGSYCFVIGKAHHSTCTVQPVPTADADTAAKRFQPDNEALIVYVVRHRWADASNLVPVSVDAAPALMTVPESMMRVMLPPGRHQLSLSWDGHSTTQTVEGRAGDIRFVQVVGSAWSLGSSYTWDAGDADGARARALKSRLIVDADVRK
jgi:hypothetical protein